MVIKSTFSKCDIEIHKNFNPILITLTASLYGGLFYDLKVRILRIQETPIRDLADHIFYGINETLNELHIINSALDKFPSDAIKVC